MDNSTQLKKIEMVNFLFVVIGVIAYAAFATNFTFDFFQPQFLWKAYNYYTLAMLDGRLDIPAFAIGQEGNYIDSKVYMYYGMLPTLPRFILSPFVDLETTPLSTLVVFLFSTFGQVFLHFSIWKRYVAFNRFSITSLLAIFGLLIVLWFGSGTFIILQNSVIYHEPYAAALCLSNIFLGLLIKDNFFLDTQKKYNFAFYALIAGLCVHTRMPTALALYCVTCFLMLICILRTMRSQGIKQKYIVNFFSIVFRNYTTPLLIMFVFGTSVLILNYLKFGDAIEFMGHNYGYNFLEGFTERRCPVLPVGEFAKVLRIIPNLYIYFTADMEIYKYLRLNLETGFGRIEDPVVPIYQLWPLSCLCFLMVLAQGIGRRREGNPLLLIGILVFSSIGAFFQLTYPTIAHRYITEFWPPLALATVLIVYINVIEGKGYNKGVLVLMAFLGAFGTLNMLNISLTSRYYLEDGPVFNHNDYHYSDSDNEYLSELTEDKIEKFMIQYRKDREIACAKYVIEGIQ
ncbi:hypothetical protein Q4574_01170 [Aliiglaciecola sp. 3_MG-2023]|uniref:hypothetical protein n=1 Tax=Aliiglaciecola sp. 3_MG-2023 TaxID=3062644 RepID=UPI0026E3BA49|nr:hypothetical protein [Aliiglaciecola sp. 3_MG-2023]MDO6691868.1 hypothetical protein [Aliiglaciecola sp. 3_MG-2023]